MNQESPATNESYETHMAKKREQTQLARESLYGAIRVYLHLGNALHLDEFARGWLMKIDGAKYVRVDNEVAEIRADEPDFLTEYYRRAEASFVEGYTELRANKRKGLDVLVTDQDILYKLARDMPVSMINGDEIVGLNDLKQLPNLEDVGKHLGSGKNQYIRPRWRNKVPVRKF